MKWLLVAVAILLIASVGYFFFFHTAVAPESPYSDYPEPAGSSSVPFTPGDTSTGAGTNSNPTTSANPSGGTLPSPSQPVIGNISTRGEISCLPHKGNEGMQTLECAIGLRADDGKFYGLPNLNQEDLISGKWSTGTRVMISGTLSAAPQSDYAIVGVIFIQSISADGSR